MKKITKADLEREIKELKAKLTESGIETEPKEETLIDTIEQIEADTRETIADCIRVCEKTTGRKMEHTIAKETIEIWILKRKITPAEKELLKRE